MAEHSRHRRGEQALHEVQVAVTQATRRDTDEDLVAGRNVDGELLDGEVARSVVEDGGADGLTSVVVGSGRSAGAAWGGMRVTEITGQKDTSTGLHANGKEYGGRCFHYHPMRCARRTTPMLEMTPVLR